MTLKYTIDLRLIAIITMLIDHLGLIFFPQQLIFRVIGRLAFPLFAWGVALGVKHTRNLPKYAWRLLLFALISQYPYYLFGSLTIDGIAKLNVIFTLLFGLLSIQIYRSQLPLMLKIACLYLLCYFSIYLDMDYQAIGVLSVLFSYIFMSNFYALFVSQFIFFASPFILVLVYRLSGFPASANGAYSMLAPFSFFFTRLQSVRSNPKFKYLFYFVYPLQYLIFYFFKTH